MNPQISVVVAAYNVEKYINRCINSIMNQSFENLEILVVNDGSLDSTAAIVKDLVAKDNRIHLINQENGGLSAARNAGIKQAKAEYIAFLDGDDYIHESMYEKLYTKMISTKSDLVICNFSKVWEDNDFDVVKKERVNLKKENLEGAFVEKFLTKHDEPFVVAWNKLYKTSIIKDNEIYFENKAFFEDVGFLPRYLYFSHKVVNVDEELHYYVQRNGSITKSYNPIIEQSSKNTIRIIKEFYNNNITKDCINAFELRLLIYQINYCLNNKKSADMLYKRVIELKAYGSYLPMKHKLAIILIKMGLYSKVHQKLRR
ncbi:MULTISPECIES: glycosyltransferase family 2 protein [Priestia]|uniref:glycosyltransferase family 2 protein n=1 Tax=Priestia TaxID=2800373 RepID=UPI002E22D664|nr:glycosyltransferase family 2 protein [Priestia aryabhattai]